MPIGSSRSGVMGAGVTPGGCEVFNAPGTFTVPAGITTVNATGKGSDGNPGNAGNAGGFGAGGGGGTAGSINIFNALDYYSGNGTSGGSGGPGQGSGNSGNPGNNPASTAFCLTFPGGTAGTGGTGGCEGPHGNSGQSGTPYNTEIPQPANTPVNCSSFVCSGQPRASGGNQCGGQGGRGEAKRIHSGNPVGVGPFYAQYKRARGGGGGGGAGTTNAGGPANQQLGNQDQPGPGGNPGGGSGASGQLTGFFITQGTPQSPQIIQTGPGNAALNDGAGGGGGGGAAGQNGNAWNDPSIEYYAAQGGGGGGRGGAGNPGNPGNAGSPANPTTHNCIAVVSGACYPITANAPVTVSWNPQ